MTKNQLINSEVSAEKEESLSKKEKFQFVLRGKVRSENNAQFLVLENGKRFKVKAIIATSYPDEIANWQVVPVTGNDGELVNLILEKSLSESELRTTPSNLLIEAGRIVEVSKKGGRIKVKVKRDKIKDLKISILGADKNVKIGQLWLIKAVLKEGYLQIQKAKYLQD